MKTKIFFYDTFSIESGTFLSLQEALAEDFVRVYDNEIVPTDECSIIYWYDRDFEIRDACRYVEQIARQKFVNEYAYYDSLPELWS